MSQDLESYPNIDRGLRACALVSLSYYAQPLLGPSSVPPLFNFLFSGELGRTG